MSENRSQLYAMALTLAICMATFMGDDPLYRVWVLRGYLYLKCHVCSTCWHGRECDLNLWTATAEDVPPETRARIPLQGETK